MRSGSIFLATAVSLFIACHSGSSSPGDGTGGTSSANTGGSTIAGGTIGLGPGGDGSKAGTSGAGGLAGVAGQSGGSGGLQLGMGGGIENGRAPPASVREKRAPV